MDFDHFSVGLLTTKSDSQRSDGPESDAIQDAHMSYLADMHETGQLLAARPTFNECFRGLLLFNTDRETATTLILADPAERAGWFDVTVIDWMVPGGAMNFTSTTFPRSMTDTA